MPRRSIVVFALLAAAAAGLWAHLQRFNFVTDDAFISFVYARNLAQHGQLVFNLGERVEGYTNFLWTVFLAGWMKLGWQPESSSIVWGYLFAASTMFVCAFWSRALRSDCATWSAWDALPALLLAAVPGYACWAGGGLETQMFTFFATLGSALYLSPSADDRLRKTSALAFGLAALTRPEGILFFGLAGLHRVLSMLRSRRIEPRSDEILWVALFLLLVVPHLLWRHHYYGWWVPNTFYVKSSGGRGTWLRGLYYLRRFAEAFLVPLLLVPPIAALFVKREPGERRLYGFALLVLPAFFAYVASVGGDFMGLFRFVLPVMPLVALTFSLGLRAIARRFVVERQRSPLIAPALVTLLLAGYAWHDVEIDRAAQIFLGPKASDNGIDTPGYLRWYTADRAAIGKWFGRYAQPDDYAAVGGAGAQVYYSGIRSLDCFGLSDEYIAHNVPARDNRPGHEKYAPVDYQLSRQPTIITSNYYHIASEPIHPADEPWWRARGYHYVSVEVPGLSSRWYTFLKRMDRSLGPLPAVNGEID